MQVGGQSNSSPLTDIGYQQAAALGRYLSQVHPTLHSPVYCSTAVRAHDTAQVMLDQPGWQGPDPSRKRIQIVSTPVLLELSQGDWEGKPRDQCYTPDVLSQIAADPWHFAAPGGESQQQLEERMVAFVNSTLLPALQYDGPPGVMVTHGLAIKCFLRHVLDSAPGMTWKIETANTSITEVAWVAAGPAAGWHLKRVNDIAHLALAGLTGAVGEVRN
eukprot:GHUV01025271.1.p1 GENE.GHUV01025271.1~~GHUV01025271.1.p1  ORF type:complete len:217 (+),score=59.80 GHUV01025271.1:1044-1694(+)